MTWEEDHPADLRYVLRWRRSRPAALVAEAVGWSELRLWRALSAQGIPIGRTSRRERAWLPEEEALLAAEYPEMGVAWCARRMGRSALSVENKARKMRLRTTRGARARARKHNNLTVSRLRRRYEVSFGANGVPEDT